MICFSFQHPVTTGSPAIDYYFGLDVEVSNAGPSHYSEQLIRMEWMNTAPVVPVCLRIYYHLDYTKLFNSYLPRAKLSGHLDCQAIASTL